MIAAQLDAALRAANIPIIGVSLGDEADRSTWKIQFHTSASLSDKTTAQALMNNFHSTADTPEITTKDVLAYVSAKFGVTVEQAILDILITKANTVNK